MILKERTKMLIKTLVLLFIMHCLLTTTNGETLKEVNVRCREKHNVEEEEIAHLNQTRHIDTPDERIKCFVKCFLTELKLMDENGELTLDDNPERKRKYKKHFAVCKDVTGTDPCDKAVNFQNCIWEQIKKEEESPL